MEAKVLAAFIESRKEHDAAVSYVRDLSPMGRAVLEHITAYYERDADATSVDTEILMSRLERKFGDVPKHARELQDYMTELYATDTSAVNVADELVVAEKSRLGYMLADAILTKNEDMIETYLKEYSDIQDVVTLNDSDAETYTGVDLSEFEEMYDESNLIRIAPPDLNSRLRGGLLRAMHLLLAAMPEAGKSLFALNMTSGFAQQGLRVLYVGNEDPITELILRLLSNMSGVTHDEIFEKKEMVMERAYERGYDLVTFKGMDPGSIEEIEAMLRQDDYDIVVIDQLRNLRAKTENNTLRLEAVAQGARNLARRYNVLVVSVTQAAESARGKLVLNSGDIDGSNIGIPGACDVMVMVGVSDDYYERDLRKLTLAKNKRGGVHDNFTVAIDRYHTRVRNFGGRE